MDAAIAITVKLYQLYWQHQERYLLHDRIGKWVYVTATEQPDAEDPSHFHSSWLAAVSAVPSIVTDAILVRVGHESAKDVFWKDYDFYKSSASPSDTCAKVIRTSRTSCTVTWFPSEHDAYATLNAGQLAPGEFYMFSTSEPSDADDNISD